MSGRPGRRVGRTLLKIRHVEARRRAIAKLDERHRSERIVIGWDGSRADALVAMCMTGDGRVRTLDSIARPIELPGHHLQRAAAENA